MYGPGSGTDDVVWGTVGMSCTHCPWGASPAPLTAPVLLTEPWGCLVASQQGPTPHAVAVEKPHVVRRGGGTRAPLLSHWGQCVPFSPDHRLCPSAGDLPAAPMGGQEPRVAHRQHVHWPAMMLGPTLSCHIPCHHAIARPRCHWVITTVMLPNLAPCQAVPRGSLCLRGRVARVQAAVPAPAGPPARSHRVTAVGPIGSRVFLLGHFICTLH